MAGKGSKQRPLGKNTSQKQFDDNWDRIFGKNKPSHDAMEVIHTVTSEFAHPAYTRYPHLKELNKKFKQPE